MSDKKSFEFLLLGKTGGGKSSTGNAILGRRCFSPSGKSQSSTDKIQSEWGQNEQFTVKVVDSPGLEDTALTKTQDKERAIINMTELMARCPEGIHAFLFVLRFGTRFTEEDMDTLHSLKGILGDNFMKDHGITVMTHGDLYDGIIEEEELGNLAFQQWCRQEHGNLKRLFKECKFRCLLFNNREKKDQTQVQSLIQMTEELIKEKGRYTNEHFVACAKERERFLVQAKAPQQMEKFQRILSLLQQDILLINSSPLDRKMDVISGAKQRYEECLLEIEKEDNKTGVYDSFRQSVQGQIEKLTYLESCLNDAVKVQELSAVIKEENDALKSSKQPKWLSGIKWGAVGGGAAGVATGAAAVGLVLATGGVASVPLVATALGAWLLGTTGGAAVGATAGTAVGGVTGAIREAFEKKP